MPELPNNPHDAFAKFALAQPQIARGFLRHCLPTELITSVDLDTIDIRPDSFVDDEGKHHLADMLYRLSQRNSDQDLWVYVLIEHKSYPDRWAS